MANANRVQTETGASRWMGELTGDVAGDRTGLTHLAVLSLSGAEDECEGELVTPSEEKGGHSKSGVRSTELGQDG